MKIGNFDIVPGCKPFCIAEISCNHRGSIETAMKLIREAKRAGADAVKFQAYTPDTITLDCNKTDFIIQDGLWKGRTLYELYSKAFTPFEWFPKLFMAAKREQIIAFASVFDPRAVALMEKLGAPAYKIASFEIGDTPLIEMAAKTGKPLIISTGLASTKDILDANTASGGKALFLHCTSEYPGTIEFSDLHGIGRLRSLLGPETLIGVSDHTPYSDIVPVISTALGAVVIEKHLRMRGDEASEDAKFSLTPEEFAVMVYNVGLTHEALKQREFAANPSSQFKRSIYAVADIEEGDIFTEANLRSIRPGYGLAPKNLPRLLGKKAGRSFRRGDRIT